jgi:hypothetical protein
MPPKKKEMSPESRAKADQRNERLALKALDHYLDLFHLCQGKFMVHCEDAKINHTALLAKCGYKFKV